MIGHGVVCDPVSLSAAFVVGMAGSVHCVAMCGGISGALALRARRGASPRHASWLALCNQLGRVTGYAIAGALVGAFSSLVQGLFDWNRLVVAARLMAGLTLLSVGIGILFKWRPLAGLERLGGRVWVRMAPLAGRLPSQSAAGALLLGMLWGWLPCGFIYSMLIFAAFKGGALQGAALMACFGLGTAPAVGGAGLLGSWLGRKNAARGLHRAAGWLILAFGLWTLLGPLQPLHH